MTQAPFTVEANQTPPRMNTTRLIEALVIAAFTALATSYVATARLEERINAQQRQLDRIERSIDRMSDPRRTRAEMSPFMPQPDPTTYTVPPMIDRPYVWDRRYVANR
jgi:hypothetical protein